VVVHVFRIYYSSTYLGPPYICYNYVPRRHRIFVALMRTNVRAWLIPTQCHAYIICYIIYYRHLPIAMCRRLPAHVPLPAHRSYLSLTAPFIGPALDPWHACPAPIGKFPTASYQYYIRLPALPLPAPPLPALPLSDLATFTLPPWLYLLPVSPRRPRPRAPGPSAKFYHRRSLRRASSALGAGGTRVL
jgi:hypothetical protein